MHFTRTHSILTTTLQGKFYHDGQFIDEKGSSERLTIYPNSQSSKSQSWDLTLGRLTPEAVRIMAMPC